MEKEEFSYTVGGNVNCKLVQQLMYVVQHFLKELKIELPYNPAIPLLGIYPGKTIICKDTCTPVFTTALFIITKTQKQPSYPSVYEGVKMR